MTHSKKSKPVQLSIFDLEQSIPSEPTLRFDDAIRRIKINGVVYFSVLDVFFHYGTTKSNPRIEWKRAKDKLKEQGFDVVTKVLQHKFEGQGQRKTDVATLNTFLRIAMVTSFKEWEDLRQFMADSSEQRIEEIHDPLLGLERSEQRAIKRYMKQGMAFDDARQLVADQRETTAIRNQMTDIVKENVTGKINYAALTDTEYVQLFMRKAKEITTETGHSNARQGMTPQALAFIRIVESTFADLLKQHKGIPFEHANEIMRDIARPLGVNVREIESITGIDMATGKPLLNSGKE